MSEQTIRRGVLWDVSRPEGVLTAPAQYGYLTRNPHDASTRPTVRVRLPALGESVVIRSIAWSMVLGSMIVEDANADVWATPVTIVGAPLMVAVPGSDIVAQPLFPDITTTDNDQIAYQSWLTERQGEIRFDDRGIDGYPSGLVIPSGAQDYAVAMGAPTVLPVSPLPGPTEPVTGADRAPVVLTLAVRFDTIPGPWTPKGRLLQRSSV